MNYHDVVRHDGDAMDNESIVTTDTNPAKRSMTSSGAEPPLKCLRMSNDNIPSRKCVKVDRRRSEGMHHLLTTLF